MRASGPRRTQPNPLDGHLWRPAMGARTEALDSCSPARSTGASGARRWERARRGLGGRSPARLLGAAEPVEVPPGRRRRPVNRRALPLTRCSAFRTSEIS